MPLKKGLYSEYKPRGLFSEFYGILNFAYHVKIHYEPDKLTGLNFKAAPWNDRFLNPT